jgi:hypothetical protein
MWGSRGIASTFPWACGALRKRYRLAEEGRAERAGVSTYGVQDAERGVPTAPKA